jgi:uncharacterized protein
VRIVALEEHYTVPAIVSRIDPAAIRRRGFPGPDVVWGQTLKRNELAQLGDARIADMDASGIALQVLSVAGPGADVVPGVDGIALARDYNNALFEATSRHPDRYQGFAHLPMHSPGAAADELERTVKDLGFRGLLVNDPTDGGFLDDPLFEPILARAEALSVPIYIHPAIPSEIREAHFDRLPGNFSFALAVSSWGWHMETAIHVLRLILVGLSIAILVSRSSSDTWARRYRSCWTASTKRPPLGRSGCSAARFARRSSIKSGSRPAGSSRWRRS